MSFELPEYQRLELVSTAGRIVVTGPTFTGGLAATSYEWERPDGEHEVVPTAADNPHLKMVEAFARSVRGVEPWPRPPEQAVAMAQLLDRLRAACP